MSLERIIETQKDLSSGKHKGDAVTDEQIEKYCLKMKYKLLGIGKTAFEYERSNGDKCALLKAAACS